MSELGPLVLCFTPGLFRNFQSIQFYCNGFNVKVETITFCMMLKVMLDIKRKNEKRRPLWDGTKAIMQLGILRILR